MFDEHEKVKSRDGLLGRVRTSEVRRIGLEESGQNEVDHPDVGRC